MLQNSPEQRLSSEWMYERYLEYCKENEIEQPAASTKMGVVLVKLFGKNSLKQHHVGKLAKYFYEGFSYLSDDDRKAQEPRVTLPPFVSFHAEHEIMAFYFPTRHIFDERLCEYHVFMSNTTGEYWVRFRHLDINTRRLGLTSFTDLDQVFVNGIIRILNSLVVCKGREVDMPPSKKDSTTIFPHTVGELGANNVFENMRSVWVSKNCRGVLPLTCEKNNTTCDKCVHDVNDRMRILRSKLSSSSENAMDDDNADAAVADVGGDGDKPVKIVGGAVRRRGSASEQEDTEDNDNSGSWDGTDDVSMFIIHSSFSSKLLLAFTFL